LINNTDIKSNILKLQMFQKIIILIGKQLLVMRLNLKSSYLNHSVKGYIWILCINIEYEIIIRQNQVSWQEQINWKNIELDI